MYKIFKDKEKIFKCKVHVQGVNISDCQARLIIQSEDLTFMLRGNIGTDGICKITIPKIKVLEEGTTGKLVLEIIADSTLFNAYESDFEVHFDKKITVEVPSENEYSDTNLKDFSNEPKEDTTIPMVSANIIDEDEGDENKDEDNTIIEEKKHIKNNIYKEKEEEEIIITKEIKEDSHSDVLDFGQFFSKK